MKEIKCPFCDATGEVEIGVYNPDFSDTDPQSTYPTNCQDCNGTGKISWSYYMQFCKWAKKKTRFLAKNGQKQPKND